MLCKPDCNLSFNSRCLSGILYFMGLELRKSNNDTKKTFGSELLTILSNKIYFIIIIIMIMMKELYNRNLLLLGRAP